MLHWRNAMPRGTCLTYTYYRLIYEFNGVILLSISFAGWLRLELCVDHWTIPWSRPARLSNRKYCRRVFCYNHSIRLLADIFIVYITDKLVFQNTVFIPTRFLQPYSKIAFNWATKKCSFQFDVQLPRSNWKAKRKREAFIMSRVDASWWLGGQRWGQEGSRELRRPGPTAALVTATVLFLARLLSPTDSGRESTLCSLAAQRPRSTSRRRMVKSTVVKVSLSKHTWNIA